MRKKVMLPHGEIYEDGRIPFGRENARTVHAAFKDDASKLRVRCISVLRTVHDYFKRCVRRVRIMCLWKYGGLPNRMLKYANLRRKNDKFPTIIKRNSGCFLQCFSSQVRGICEEKRDQRGVVSKDLPSSCLHNLLTLNVVLVH